MKKNPASLPWSLIYGGVLAWLVVQIILMRLFTVLYP